MQSNRETHLSQILADIQSRELSIGVIGLGHVGFPLSLLLCNAGVRVVGVENDAYRLSLIESGRNPLAGEDEQLSPLLSKALRSGRYLVSNDTRLLGSCRVIMVAVATPIDDHQEPDLLALSTAVAGILENASEGTLVIVESTIPPGTCSQFLTHQIRQQTRLVLDHTIFLGCSPERVMPGRFLSNQLALSRVCGADAEDVGRVLATLYSELFGIETDITDTTTAELVKTVENAYRDVQIAFANEVAIRCSELGVDFLQVQRLVNKVPRRDLHDAGIGVGGHCIPKDPFLMIAGSRQPNDLIRSARSVNDRMPHFVCDLIDHWFSFLNLNEGEEKSVCLLGYSYLPDSGDVRNSPAKDVAEELHRRGYRVTIHDPYVADFQNDLVAKINSANLSLKLVQHSHYLSSDLSNVVSFHELLMKRKSYG